MFLGEYHTRFTGQGRMVLPKKFRQQLGGEKEIILSRGFEGCIMGFSIDEWKREAEKHLETPITDEKGRSIRRYLFSAAEEVRLDDQGRFIISGSLLEFAGLNDEVVLIGAGDHFEIWDLKSWKKMIKTLTT